MDDPVITPNGTSYDRAQILLWLEEHSTDPFTREPLSSNQLVANRNLSAAIAYYRRHEMRFAIPIRVSNTTQ
jgi:hypothetical protein